MQTPTNLARITLISASFIASMWGMQANAWEVRLYGGVDIGISYVNVSRGELNDNPATSGSQLGLNSSELDDSMFGITGQEDLGNGWRVMFDLAALIDAPTGEMGYDEFFGIESSLGMSHTQWGSLVLGRQQTISTDFFTNIDPLSLSFGQANMGTSFTAINTQYYNNLVQYTSPSFSGLQFGVGYSFDTGDTAVYADSDQLDPVPSNNGFGTMDKMRALTLAVQYEKGPLLAVASYDTAYASSVIPSGDSAGQTVPNTDVANPQAWYLGLAYTLGDVVVSGAWGRGVNGALSGSGPGGGISDSPLPPMTGDGDMLFSRGFNHDAYLLGFAWNIDDRTEFMASWQMLKPTGPLAQLNDSGTQQIVGAALTYSLSSRTTVYVWGSYGNNFQMLKNAKTSVISTGIQTMF
jgi:predicted porin